MTRHALVVAAFVASLLVVLATPLCTRDRVAETTPWVDAVAHNAALGGPPAPSGMGAAVVRRGDVVLVHPPWRDDVARALAATGALPAGAKATVALAPRHGDALPPIVVVTDESAPLPDVLDELVDDATRVHKDGITLMRLRERKGDGRGRSLLDALRDARVEIQLGASDERIACPWDAAAERHVCVGQPEWQHVGMTELPIGGAKVRCAWAHPKTDATLSIRFAQLQVDDVIDVSLALSDGAADNPSGAAVTAALFVDGTEAGAVTTKARQRGFAKKSARTTPGAHDVEVRITTPNDGQRHACILLETRGAP